MPVHPVRPSHRCFPVVLLALGLSGCVDAIPDAMVGKGDIRNAIAKGTMVSPSGATVAITSLEGGGDAVEARFAQSFVKEAAGREITMADAKAAHYLVRGYLSAYPSDKGTDVSYVCDIFDANSQSRVNRVVDVLTIPGSAPDAWALVDDQVMASLAGRSADDLAVALAGTPEAQIAATRTAAAGSTTNPVQ